MDEEGLPAWVRSELGDGELGAPRVRPWARVWRVASGEALWWLKVNSATTAYEPPLTRLLHELAPDLVPAVRVHPERPWALVPDAGQAAREVIGAGRAAPEVALSLWSALLPRYAELQQGFPVGRAAEVGLLDASPAALVGALDALLAEPVWLLEEYAPELTDAERQRIRGCRAPLGAAVEALAQGRPSSVQHDDLHAGNVFLDPATGAASIIDWGDASLGHPFGTLLVILRALAAELHLPAGDPMLRRVRAAYLEPWRTRGESDAELDREVALVLRTGPLVRALSWRRALGTPAAGVELEMSDGVASWLLRLADALAVPG